MITAKVRSIKSFSNAERTRGLRTPVPAFDYVLASVDLVLHEMGTDGVSTDKVTGSFAAMLISGGQEPIILPHASFSAADPTGLLSRCNSTFKSEDVSDTVAEAISAMQKSRVETLLNTTKWLLDTMQTVSDDSAALTAEAAKMAVNVEQPVTEASAEVPNPEVIVQPDSNVITEPRVILTLINPTDQTEIPVVPEAGESDDDAIARIKKQFNIT